jgi:hypothetical protein
VYCQRSLERGSIEHIDGMNRFQAGLHVPGNVVVACGSCHKSKSRAAESSWESFLSQDEKFAEHWAGLFPEEEHRNATLEQSRSRIVSFRSQYEAYLNRHDRTRLLGNLEDLYRECQTFAAKQIEDRANLQVQADE